MAWSECLWPVCALLLCVIPLHMFRYRQSTLMTFVYIFCVVLCAACQQDMYMVEGSRRIKSPFFQTPRMCLLILVGCNVQHSHMPGWCYPDTGAMDCVRFCEFLYKCCCQHDWGALVGADSHRALGNMDYIYMQAWWMCWVMYWWGKCMNVFVI